MKRRIAIPILTLAIMVLGAPGGLAQRTNLNETTPAKQEAAPKAADSGSQTSSSDKSKGKKAPSIKERPIVIPRESGSDSSDSGKGKAKPDKPNRPDNPALPTGVKSLVTNFQTARETYLNQQQELRRQLKQATDEEREAIRERIRESLEQWKEQHQQFVKEVKDRAKEMKQQLDPALGRVIDQGGQEGRGR